jgi:glycosyltransferase 2 family protein
MKKKLISIALRSFVSVLLIVLLLYIMRDRYADIVKAIKGMRPAVFGMSVLVFACAICAASFRLKLLACAQENTNLKFIEAVSLTFIGYFFNNFLPTSIGGDVVKAYYLARKTPNKTASFTAVFVDRAMGLFTMVFMAFAALLFVQDWVIDANVKKALYGITAATAAIVFFIMNKRFAKKFSFILRFIEPFREKLANLYYAINRYRHHGGLIVKSIGISVISQLLFFTSIGILALSIGVHISVVNILLFMPIVSMMSLLPSINGLGLREGSIVLLFGPLIGKPNAFAVSILLLFLLIITSVAGGLVYAMSPQFRMPIKKLRGETV